jgi:hypothetical protein
MCRLDYATSACPPATNPVYEWAFNQAELRWVDWMETIPEYRCNPEQPFAEIIVPTSDTVRYTFIMRSLLLAGSHVLAVGETGTGKTLTIQVPSSHCLWLKRLCMHCAHKTMHGHRLEDIVRYFYHMVNVSYFI